MKAGVKSPNSKVASKGAQNTKPVVNEEESQKENIKSNANLIEEKKELSQMNILKETKSDEDFQKDNQIISKLSCKDSLDFETDLLCDEVIEVKKESLNWIAWLMIDWLRYFRN